MEEMKPVFKEKPLNQLKFIKKALGEKIQTCRWGEVNILAFFSNSSLSSF